ncbi:hypothetical protein, variant [Aphanomyces astaci]|uniref:ESF1 RRM domain-containing protein n=1 Tax=Aphanomyces astaci TaxID=112090 RepID=W4G3M6_APHAT|nr:hypothetical protein, variant [Aphanomyces astaci]ETV73629.1 hypothetical protein, variant [Aphanomyces astaci]|eukprot:XP_009837055.1 hypothetical protein, variant [Aphanomyces astaci]
MSSKKQSAAAPTSVVTDPRFIKVHNDPRFARNSKKKNKVQLDTRFKAVLTDKKFQSVQGKYDKYGRRVEKQDNDMKKFYNVEGEDSDDEDTGEVASKKPSTAAERRIAYLNKKARGELSGESSSSSSEESSDDDGDDIEEDIEEDNEEEDIPLGDETKRFAIMNCDWSRMRAVDLLALFQSFLPAAGILHSVVVYPSDFGLARMADEQKFGPQGLWADKPEKSGDESDDESGDEIDEADPLGIKNSAADADDGFDKEKLRRHELDKLKYYYAVATFNSVSAASAVFDACDGLEYETSSNTLDLRFVPNDVTFNNPPKESATAVPDTYTPSIFATLALQNTELECTWDEGDGARVDKLTRPANWKDLKDDDFAAYVAMSDEDDAADKHEDDLDALKLKYRKALLGSDADDDDDSEGEEDGNKKSKKTSSHADEFGDGDMEMTFNDSMDVLKAKQARDAAANETPFEKYQREKKHEKNVKKHEKRVAGKAAHAAQLDTMKNAAKTVKAKAAAVGDGDVEEDEEDKRDFDMKFISKLEKHKDKKGKRHKTAVDKLKAHATGLQQGFAFNATDNRFAQLVTNHPDYSLDPTDARFKRTEVG